MLKLERVSKFYTGNGLVSTGFSKVDLELRSGEFVAITGESGSGKSTLLNVISGLDGYEEGEMYVMGEPTSGYTKEELEAYRKTYIGNIFQTFNLINSYTVYQNVELVLLLSGYDPKQIPDRVNEILNKVGLAALAKKKASKLSGGQKQRVAIARALAKETPVIVADEPTGNLDLKAAAEIIQLLHELSKDKLIIIVTHNYEQVEPYVTRKITMHDGRIAEDKQVTPVAPLSAAQIKTAKADGLSVTSHVRLGLRNTFNLPAKFLLLCTVFLFLCIGTISMYATVQNMGEAMDDGWNDFFQNTSRHRILVTKPDKSEFSDEDYVQLEAIENVDHIIKNDLTLDLQTSITESYEKGTFWINAQLAELAAYKPQLAEGRLPKNSKEAMLMIPREGYVAAIIQDAMDKKVIVTDNASGNQLFEEKIRIVGYGYLTDEQEKDMEESSIFIEALLCVNQKAMSAARFACLEKYCRHEITFAEKTVEGNPDYGEYPLVPSEYVEKGQVYIPESIAYLSDYAAYGQTLRLTNKSLYFEDKYKFTVGAVYNENNCNAYLGITNYDEINTSNIYLHPADYQRIYDKGNFQSSIMTADGRRTKETAQAIEAAGYETFVVREGVVNYNQEIKPVYDMFRMLLLAGVLVVLFFITYFIVKLILKSRNIYYSTIRMLGATKENCSNLLKLELFTVFNLTFFLCAAFVAAAKRKLVPVELLQEMSAYLETGDFVLLYVMLCMMTMLLAVRYAKQLFKQTAMNAYKEEV